MNIAHYKNSKKPLERAQYWLCTYSWNLGGDEFETLQDLSKELETLQAHIDRLWHYVGNPSAWEYYDETVSEVIRQVVETARTAIAAAEPEAADEAA